MIWKQEWYTRLFALLAMILFALTGFPPREVFGRAGAVGTFVCALIVGRILGWVAFSIQERRRLSRRHSGTPRIPTTEISATEPR